MLRKNWSDISRSQPAKWSNISRCSALTPDVCDFSFVFFFLCVAAKGYCPKPKVRRTQLLLCSHKRQQAADNSYSLFLPRLPSVFLSCFLSTHIFFHFSHLPVLIPSSSYFHLSPVLLCLPILLCVCKMGVVSPLSCHISPPAEVLSQFSLVVFSSSVPSVLLLCESNLQLSWDTLSVLVYSY